MDCFIDNHPELPVKQVGNWSNQGYCNPTDNDRSCGPGIQQQVRMCVDGMVDKCQDSDFKRFVPCNLEACYKVFGPWSDVGSCMADGDNISCGPGKQNQTRLCKDGTSDICSESDRHQVIDCSMADCVKELGQWNTTAPCQPDASEKTCGPGVQHQIRSCSDGTTEKCTEGDRNQEVRCDLVECTKLVGNWTTVGICESSGDHKVCGKGVKKQTRPCVDGTIDFCTATDTEKYIECSLEACFKEVGNWTDVGFCVGKGARTYCGPGFQRQSRICIDGAIANCTESDRERNVLCSLPDCSKEIGYWINEGNCTAWNGQQCGPGNQIQTRTCVNGTKLKCTPSDMLRIQTCNLQHCPKSLGNWSNVGDCLAVGVDKNCGPGDQFQTRWCVDGTIDHCTKRDRQHSISCDLPDCEKKLGDWVDIGECNAVDTDTPCGPLGSGLQNQRRTCTDGTKNLCQSSDMEQTISCVLPKCPGKLASIMQSLFMA